MTSEPNRFDEPLQQTERSMDEVSDSEKTQKHRDAWRSSILVFFQSASGAALITVVLGGIGGGLITQLIQVHMSNREEQRLSIASYTKNQQDVANDALAIIGNGSTTAQDLGNLVQRRFRADILNSTVVEAQNQKTLQAFNTADESFRASRQLIGFRIQIYYHNSYSISNEWDETADSLALFMDCRRLYYQEHVHDDKPPMENDARKACFDERERLSLSEKIFITAISALQEAEYAR